ncbi:MAG TPA: hypothetical protein VHO84_10980, partial [Syntrophorhabdaceae bacterium]|nr:hypothetical protein [Syntrophorhabdaceae bacterium]
YTEEELTVFREFGMYDVVSGFKGKGCERCNNSGYIGRTVIGEVLVIDDNIRELIYTGVSIPTIKEKAVKKGMKPLKHQALLKAAEGVTTVDEVLRVVG